MTNLSKDHRKDTIMKSSITERIRNMFKKHLSLVIVFIAAIVAFTNYLVYPAFINKQLDLVEIPIANIEIGPNTQITKEQLSFISFPMDALPTNIFNDENNIVGMFTKDNMTLIQGSFFYSEALVTKEKAVGSLPYELSDGQVAYTLTVDQTNGAKKNLRKGQYIDLYFLTDSTRLNTEKIISGKISEHVRIIDVNLNSNEEAEYIVLAIMESDVDSLMIAETIGQVMPIINWQSGLSLYQESQTYDIHGLKNLLREYALCLRKTDILYEMVIDDQ